MSKNRYRREDIVDRIIENLIVDEETSCWVWQGGTSGDHNFGKTGRGYGRISINGHTSAVHRVMYVCTYGYIPNRMQVDHTCNNRLCCNPEHLEIVTPKKNAKRKKS